jgi:hypothetical protein
MTIEIENRSILRQQKSHYNSRHSTMFSLRFHQRDLRFVALSIVRTQFMQQFGGNFACGNRATNSQVLLKTHAF